MVGIFHLALLHVGGCAHVMVGPNDQACTFAREKLPNRLDFLPGGFLLGDHMVEAEHHEGVGVSEDTLIQRETLTGLIDALINGHGMSRGVSDEAPSTGAGLGGEGRDG